MKKTYHFFMIAFIIFFISCAEENITSPGEEKIKITDSELTVTVDPNNENVTYQLIEIISFTDGYGFANVPGGNNDITYGNISAEIMTAINGFSSSRFTVVATRTDQLGDVLVEGTAKLAFNVKFIAKGGYEFATLGDKSVVLTVTVRKEYKILDTDIDIKIEPLPRQGVTYVNMAIIEGNSPPTGNEASEPPLAAAAVASVSHDVSVTYNDLVSDVTNSSPIIGEAGNGKFEVRMPINIPSMSSQVEGRSRLTFDMTLIALGEYTFKDNTTSKIIKLPMHTLKLSPPN